jgi:hypothetical protein
VVGVAVGITFFVLGANVDMSDACRTFARQGAEDKALKLFGVAAAASVIAAAACLFGVVLHRRRRRSFLVGIVACLVVLALACYGLLGTSLECAFD